ncbi:MAG: RNA methyltransferase [Bacteroidetes bacterium]|nr:RNA methyltransferase [Bacteroidota bacterium]
MRQFKTEKRLNKITKTLVERQHSLAVIIENVHDPHNVSAIFRSCDAVGVPNVSLLYTNEDFPKINRITSASSQKWVTKDTYSSVKECFDDYHTNGFKIYASLLSEDAVDLYDIDFTEKVAVVLGNEHRGISDEVKELADAVFYIPMHGMIQSLNVSVAAAVTLYEAQRQRREKGLYEKSELPKEEFEKLVDEWCKK